MAATYSFLDVTATIVGPGGNVQLGAGSAVSEEGITIEPTEDKTSMLIGADGEGMHSLHAGKSGSITVRFLKTSQTNNLLQVMYDIQAISSGNAGNNTIVVTNRSSGDTTTCRQVAFRRKPTITYSKEGQMMEWTFNAVKIDTILGKYPV
jgi:hypothetical protein